MNFRISTSSPDGSRKPHPLKLKYLFSKKKRRAARRAAAAQLELPPDIQGWQPGQVYRSGDTAEAHMQRLIENILAETPGSEPGLEMIRETITAMPDAHERDHTWHHLARLLQTYTLVPEGPGHLLDVAASPIYAAPLHRLKKWRINPVEILAFDYERDPLPFESSSQDGVMLCEVMEHFVIDPLYCFIEINRVLKRGGFFLLTTPNVASWFSIYQGLNQRHPNRWPVYAGRGNKEPNHIHAREYLVPEIEVLLEAAGFEVEVMLTRDYGIAPEYAPIPGFDETHRGETIFCRARKAGPPKKRYVTPVYLEDRDYSPAPETRLRPPTPGAAQRLARQLGRRKDRLRRPPLSPGRTPDRAPEPPLSARERRLSASLGDTDS